MDMGSDKGNIRSEINVTPLVDVCLVLLIIFMVITPMLSGGKVSLPQTQDPSKKPEDTKQVSLVIEATTPPTYSIDQKRLSKQDFINDLNDLYQRAPNKDIVIKADKNLHWGDVKDVMQIAKDAGFENVGIITEKKPKGIS